MIPEQPGNVYIAASLLETDWMDDLLRKHPDAQFIFIVEGVLMYFYEKQVRAFLHHVASRFGGGELWFDVCGTMMSRHGVKPDSLRKHEAQIRSGLSDGHLVEQWEPSLRLIEQANYMKFFRPRWGFFFGQILGRMTRLCYKFSSLLGYRIISHGSTASKKEVVPNGYGLFSSMPLFRCQSDGFSSSSFFARVERAFEIAF